MAERSDNDSDSDGDNMVIAITITMIERSDNNSHDRAKWWLE